MVEWLPTLLFRGELTGREYDSSRYHFPAKFHQAAPFWFRSPRLALFEL